SAHFRLAASGAKLGLPEVALGLLPGSGGTQRLPRLVGAGMALDLMLSGRHIDPAKAKAAGLVDRIVEAGDVSAAGLSYANELLAAGTPIRRTCDAQGLADREAAQAAIDAARGTAAKARGLLSPGKIVDAVQAALDLSFEEGMAKERELFIECLNSPQRAGLVHAFFAEREAAKSPETRSAT